MAATEKQDEKGRQDAGVATPKENEALKHTAEMRRGEKDTMTTRNDLLDLGVPMEQGDPAEPVGPEDAFGPGPKRGDYSKRTGGVQSFEAVRADDPAVWDGQPGSDGDPYVRGEDGQIVDNKPHTVLVAQVPRASEQGEVPREKGGVTTG